jgi:hypothetical protein
MASTPTRARRFHEAVEVAEEQGHHRLAGALGPEQDVDRPVLGHSPHDLGVVRHEGRRLTQETLVPNHGSIGIAHRDAYVHHLHAFRSTTHSTSCHLFETSSWVCS